MDNISFDAINNESVVPYAYTKGNSRVVVIKAGLGGDYSGYENKYLQISRILNEKYGVTVICISNPEENYPETHDADIIARVISEVGIEIPEISLVGVSNGANKGLKLAADTLTVKHLLLVNMPLMVNYHKTLKYISTAETTEITLVCSERDPSYSYVPFLELKHFPNLKIVRVPKADHQFIGMLREFIELVVGFFDFFEQ